jgi:sterol desaturase/sphingolipid hydroxylase (fatty acid hydroxylase superfamily)
MKLNIIAFGIPLFIGLIYIEYIIIKRKKLNYSNLHESINNISIGIAERLCDVLVTGLFYYIYDSIQKHYGIFNIQPSVFLWILLLLATDFIWYWYHRLAHEMNILWALHVVHHQSEDFNFTVSARITVLQAVARTGFWCVLPFIGFSAPMITGMLLVHGLYPFFIHTRLVGKLGVLEYLFVTPSHHRVHHACNEQYLDKNYGDVFIIWDKLFGTFKKEDEEPVYGLTHPLKTYSFLWQHFHYFIEIAVAIQQQPTLKAKWKIIFGRPDALDPTARAKAEEIFHIKQNKSTIEKPLNNYVIWQMVLLLVGLFVFILTERYLSIGTIVAFTTFTILTLINCGAIMEQKRWIYNVEFLRVFSLLAIAFQFHDHAIILSVLSIIAIAAFIYYRPVQNRYLSLVYRYQQ